MVAFNSRFFCCRVCIGNSARAEWRKTGGNAEFRLFATEVQPRHPSSPGHRHHCHQAPALPAARSAPHRQLYLHYHTTNSHYPRQPGPQLPHQLPSKPRKITPFEMTKFKWINILTRECCNLILFIARLTIRLYSIRTIVIYCWVYLNATTIM